MTRIFYSTFFLMMVVLTTAAHAAVVKNLYQAQVPVANQSAQERYSAAQAALQTVLVKVSGSTSVLKNPILQKNIFRANSYIEQYSYGDNSANDPAMPYSLNVHFLPASVNKLLVQALAPVWGKDRPLIILWISTTTNGTEHLIGANDPTNIANAFQMAANTRGLPIVFPLLDNTDTQQVSLADVKNGNLAAVSQASIRYGSNAIVMVQCDTSNSAEIKSHWIFSFNGEQSTQDFTGSSVNAIASEGINALAEILASQLSVVDTGSKNGIPIKIDGINDINQLAAAQRYLQQLSIIKSISIVSIQPTSVLFNLTLVNDVGTLQKIIATDNILKPIDLNSPTLEYQWTT
jgi:hypothetical protein